MARGMTRWLAVVLVGCLVTLGAVRAWQESLRRQVLGPRPATPEVIASDSLAREAVATATAIQRVRWSRDIGAPRDSLVVLGRIDLVPAGSRAAIREARERLRADGADGPAGADAAFQRGVAVAVLSPLWQRPDDGIGFPPRGYSRGIDYLLPEGGPCQVAVYVPGGGLTGRNLNQLIDPVLVMGPCAWVARYGPPGDSVRAWLRRGGGALAGATSPSAPSDPQDDAPYAVEAACRAGDAGACREIVRRGTLRPRVGVARVAPEDPLLYEHARRAPFAGLGAHLLADIEAEVGRDAFARFWHAEAPADQALSAALGRPVGEWVAEWAAARLPARPRVGAGPGDVLLTLLAVALLAGIALWTGARGRPLGGL